MNNNYKTNKIYKTLDTTSLGKTKCKDKYECDEDILIENIKYIKILPINWNIQHNNSLNFKEVDKNDNTLFGQKYILSDAYIDSTAHNINKTLIKMVPNIFKTYNNGNINTYWKYIYDINNPIHNVGNINSEYICNIISQMLDTINSSEYIKNILKSYGCSNNIISLNILYKTAILDKLNHTIAKNIHKYAQVYRILFSYQIFSTEYFIEITVSEIFINSVQELTLLHIGLPINKNQFSKYSSIIPQNNDYTVNHTCISNQVGLSIINKNMVLRNNIYIYPSLYATIDIPNNYRVKKIKINSNLESNYNNYSINIWESYLDKESPMRLHQTGCFNKWIQLNNFNFIGQNPYCNPFNKTKGNYLLIEIPYINIEHFIIYGGEIILTKSTNNLKDNFIQQVEISNKSVELYENSCKNNIEYITSCNINNSMNQFNREGIPCLDNTLLRYPLLNNTYILSNCVNELCI